MKNRLFVFIILLMCAVHVNAQNQKQYLIITIEKEARTGLHKRQIDYWIVSSDLYMKPNEKAFFPVYLSGFSATDYKECCENNNLILFNVTTEESFEFSKEFLESQIKLSAIIEKKRKKLQSVEKKWISGKKEKINIYLTPITGNFCFCELSHYNDNSKIGYEGKISMPESNFEYDSSFWTSELFNGIKKYDFGTLPFIGLDTLQ